jgi:hypothetical protein
MDAAAQQQNLESLWRGILNREEIQAALAILEGRSEDEVRRLLRHHREGTVTGGEIAERDRVDSFLGVCGQLTVATVAGFVPRKWDGEIAARIGAILRNPPVRAYYESHYPLLLPRLLREACTEDRLLPGEDEEASWGAFQWFWRFSTRFLGDTELWWFLSLLDGFHYGSLNIDSFAEFLADPQRALAGVQKLPEQRTMAETCTIGMIRFLEFSREFGDALRQMEGTPLTRSAIWYHYAYWYREFADVREHGGKFLTAMLAWMDAPSAGFQSRREAESAVASTRQALAELTGSLYAGALLDALETKPADTRLAHFSTYR